MNKQDFLDANRVRVRKVKNLEGEDVYIRSATIADGQRFMRLAKATDPAEQAENAISMFIATACDENGNRLFEDTEEDREALKQCDQDNLTHILTEASKFNRTNRESVEEAKKNSSATPGVDFPSDLPHISV